MFGSKKPQLVSLTDSGIIWKNELRLNQVKICLEAINRIEKEYKLYSEEIISLIKELKDIYSLLFEYYNDSKCTFDKFKNMFPNLTIKQINEKKDKLLSLISEKPIDVYLFEKYEKEFMKALMIYEENIEIIKLKVKYYNLSLSLYALRDEDKINLKKLKRFIQREQLPLLGKVIEMHKVLEKFELKKLNDETKKNIYNLKILCGHLFKESFEGFTVYTSLKNQIIALENNDIKFFAKWFKIELECDEALGNKYPLAKKAGKVRTINNLLMPSFSTIGKAAILILTFLSTQGKVYAENYIQKLNHEINIEHSISGNEINNDEMNKLFEKYYNLLINDTSSDREMNIKNFNFLLNNNKDNLLSIIQIYERLSQISIKVNSKYNSKNSFSFYFNYVSQQDNINLLEKNHEQLIKIVNLLNLLGNNVYDLSEHDISGFEMLMASLCYSDNSILILNKLIHFLNDSQIAINGLEYYNFLYQLEGINHEQFNHYLKFINDLEFLFSSSYFKNSTVFISLFDFNKEYNANPLVFKDLVGLLNKIDTRDEKHHIGRHDFLNLFNIIKSNEFIYYFLKYLNDLKINMLVEEFKGIIQYYKTIDDAVIKYNNNDFLKVLKKLNKKGYEIKLASDLFNIMYYSSVYDNNMLKLTARYNVTHFARFHKNDLNRLLNLINSNRGVAHIFKSKKQHNKEAVIFYSKADYNSVLSSNDDSKSNFSSDDKRFKISQIPENYNITVFEVNNDQEMVNFIEKLNKKIDLLVIVGHGHPNHVKFGYTPVNDLFNPTEDEIKDFRLKYDSLYFDLSDTLKAKKIISYMNKGGSLVFNSCSVGEGEDSQDNLINFLAKFSSEITVYGATSPIQHSILRFDQNGSLIQITYYDQGNIVKTYSK
jgi:hypothetical protein